MPFRLDKSRSVVLALILLLVLLLSIAVWFGISRRQESQPPTAVPPTVAPATEVPPTDVPPAEQPTEQPAAEQPQSPLPEGQSESPLAVPAQAVSPLPTPAITAAEVEVSPGASYVRGRLQSGITGAYLAREAVRLPKVVCLSAESETGEQPPAESETTEQGATAVGDDCFYALSDSFTPGALTDEDGYFEFPDLEAGEYLILVGDMMTLYAFVTVDNETTPFRFTAPADEAIDLGDVLVDYQ